MASSLKNSILKVTRRTKRGFTVGEIFDRLEQAAVATGVTPPLYSSVRARVYELARDLELEATGFRPDTFTRIPATTFRRA